MPGFGVMDPSWAELIAGVVGAVLGWFSKHFLGGK